MFFATIATLAALSCGVDPAFLRLSTPLEYRYTGGGYHDELFEYRLFEPNDSGSSEKRPLVVWLHGNCESNRDNVAHLKWLDQFVFQYPWDKGRHTFYLLAVQCPRDNTDWCHRSSASTDDMVNVVAAVLEKTLQDYPIDRDRVLLAGVSSGGTGCWELAERHPEFFTAIAPMGSAGGDLRRIDSLRDIPVWAFHSQRDSNPPVGAARSTVELLKAKGGIAHLTEIDSDKHDCWTAAFTEFHVLNWLLSQNRALAAAPPGVIPWRTRLADFVSGWRWWQIVMQIGVGVLFVILVRASIRPRRRVKNLPADNLAPDIHAMHEDMSPSS